MKALPAGATSQGQQSRDTEHTVLRAHRGPSSARLASQERGEVWLQRIPRARLASSCPGDTWGVVGPLGIGMGAFA